jgi:hypothetical protein
MIIMSVKFQITLPEDLAFRLKREAARRKTPLAQFIRETMERELRSGKPGGNRFLASIRGIARDCHETDLSSRVDEILYGPDSQET